MELFNLVILFLSDIVIVTKLKKKSIYDYFFYYCLRKLLQIIFRMNMNVFLESRSDSLQIVYMTVNAINNAEATTWKPAVEAGK